MANAKSTYTIAITSAGAGQSGGSTIYTISGRDPLASGSYTTIETGVNYSEFPYDVDVYNYFDNVRILPTSNAYGCTIGDDVDITPSIYRYDYYGSETTSTAACNNTSNQGDVYIIEELAVSPDSWDPVTYVYTDADLTTALVGSGNWIKFASGSGVNRDEFVVQVNASGRFTSEIIDCNGI